MTIYQSKDGNKFYNKEECINYESLLEDEKAIYSLLTKDGKEYIQENVGRCFTEYKQLISKYFPEALKLFDTIKLDDKEALDCFYKCLEFYDKGSYPYTVICTDSKIIKALADIILHIKQAQESKTVKANSWRRLPNCFKEMFNN